MRRLVCLLLLASFPFATPLRAQIQQQDVTLTMDDGVDLDATFFRPGSTPPGSGFPCVVLVHGLGGKKEHMFDVARYLVLRGYAALSYSVRGQGKSGGVRTFSGQRERQDLREIIRWLGERPDVDADRIAVLGGSQGGQHAWWSALYGLGVRTAVAVAGYVGDLSSNGCIETYVLGILSSSKVRYGPVWRKAYEWVLDDQYDSLKAILPQPDDLVSGVDVPFFLSLAYRDWLFAVNEGIRQFQLLPGPKQLHLGTGAHGAEEVGTVMTTLIQLAFEWLDRYLKGSPPPGPQEERVVYHVDETWDVRSATQWPPEDAVPVTFYLAPEGKLTLKAPDDVLLVVRQRLLDPGYTPRRAVNDRFGPATVAKFGYDVLSFVSAPFPNDVEWAGSPHCTFHVRWNGPKMQLHVQFYDVDPSGNWRFLQRGNIAVRSGARDTLLVFDAQAYAHVFRAGHRLGIRITPLDYVPGEEMCYVLPFFTDFVDTLVGTPDSPLAVELPLRGWNPASVAFSTVPAEIPREWRLRAPYPNPFNSTVTIEFEVRARERVLLQVLDARGRKLRDLVAETVGAGVYRTTWDGLDARGLPVSSGVYVVRMQVGTGTVCRKICLLR